ncbi:ABC transporter permease [Thermococcus litoralis DSM 5473]|uniref:ABC transporter permease n=1 Tax=Thermococcus litoralis (strain ATCC 51850 / DSM 5473 / JCM 8560 / NS-C) TaxID=523849 RepID=H3ZPF5_THELN|nr:ABC transporter permease [Thermococcus litoralis]EHR78190.1 ABC transporter permease [Thermococcus litoralis DSM 5473]
MNRKNQRLFESLFDKIFSFLEIAKTILKSRRGKIGLMLLALPFAMAIAPQYIAPYDPWKIVDAPFLPPSWDHLLGTNDIGQDVFSELVYGARISLFVGITAAVSTVVIGTLVGLLAGYYGKIIDEALMAVTDVMLLIPILPFMILLASILGQGYMNIVITIAIFSWPGIARMVRAQVLSLKERDYVEAARALGASNKRIMFKHILPQLLPLLVAFTLMRVGGAMIAEASLSFLGLGDPSKKSWGAIIYWARNSGAISSGLWWWITAPGIMITITVLGFTQIGYAIEEYINPRLKQM